MADDNVSSRREDFGELSSDIIQSSVSGGVHRLQRSDGVSGPVLSWATDHGGIVPQVDQHAESSTSSTSTLRADSLTSPPSIGPASQQQATFHAHSSMDHVTAGQVLALHQPPVIDLASFSEPKDLPAHFEVLATGSAFPESEESSGVLSRSVDNVSRSAQPSRAGLSNVNVGTNAEGSSYLDLPSNPSSIVTTSSGPADICNQYTVDCFAFIKRGHYEWFTSLLDTGSEHNVISADVPKRMGIQHLLEESSEPPIKVLNYEANVIGRLPLTFAIPERLGRRLVKVRFEVVPEDDCIESLLCAATIDKLGLLPDRASVDDGPGRR